MCFALLTAPGVLCITYHHPCRHVFCCAYYNAFALLCLAPAPLVLCFASLTVPRPKSFAPLRPTVQVALSQALTAVEAQSHLAAVACEA